MYAHLVQFFNAKELEIEKFKALSGSTKKNGFVTVNTVMNDKTHKLLVLIVQKDAERVADTGKCRSSAPPSSTSASREAADATRDGNRYKCRSWRARVKANPK